MIELPNLNFPKIFEFKFKQENSKVYIFDQIRRKYLLLTPEEFVRQNVINYFIEFENQPKSAFVLEKKIELNKTTKRIDILIMQKGFPSILVECKAPEIPITEKTFQQIARYNSIIKAKKIFLTNGISHFLFEFDAEKNEYKQIKIPF